MREEILEFIELIKSSCESDMVKIFTQGSCFKFHLILKSKFPKAEPYKVIIPNNNYNHVISKIGNNYYDISGEFLVNDKMLVNKMNDDDIQEASEWIYPGEDYIRLIDKKEKLKIKYKISRIIEYLIYILMITTGIVGYKQISLSRKYLNIVLVISTILSIIIDEIKIGNLNFGVSNYYKKLFEFFIHSVFLFSAIGLNLAIIKGARYIETISILIVIMIFIKIVLTKIHVEFY